MRKLAVLLFLFITNSALANLDCFPLSFNQEQVLSLTKKVTKPLVLDPKVASDILINTFYQNCDASKLPPYDILQRGEMQGYKLEKHPWNGGSASKIVDKDAAKNSQYYVNCQEKAKEGCKNLCDTPPTYIWGGKGKYSKEGEVDIFENENSIEKIAKHPGIDCSGFVNAIFAMSGLKVRTDMKTREVAAKTPARWFMNESTCFERVDAGSELKPGDVIAWKKHIVMVDKVTPDPFGIDHIKSHKDCKSKNIDPLKIKLVVSNSLGGINDENKDKKFDSSDLFGDETVKSTNVPLTGVGIGVSKVPLGHLAMKYPSQIMELAKTACLAKFGKSGKRSKIQVTRHKLAGKKDMPNSHACLEKMEDRVKVKGVECLTKNCNF